MPSLEGRVAIVTGSARNIGRATARMLAGEGAAVVIHARQDKAGVDEAVQLLTAEGANFRVIEFHGETVRAMSTSGRLTLCNMSVEAGATSGIVPGDAETVR